MRRIKFKLMCQRLHQKLVNEVAEIEQYYDSIEGGHCDLPADYNWMRFNKAIEYLEKRCKRN